MRCIVYFLAVLLCSQSVYGQSIVQTNYRAISSFRSHLPLNIAETHTLTSDQKRHLECLAWNLYFEARGGVYKEKIAVTYVPLNRTQFAQFSLDVCDNVFHTAKIKGKNVWQFSWAGRVLKSKFVRDDKAWNESQTLAYQVLTKSVQDYGQGSIYFYQKDAPNKLLPCKKKIPIGTHIFCKSS